MCVLQENVLKLLRPWKNLSVGEAMIKIDGMLLWKQYMPKKHVRWGIKIWCLYDSLKGYCLAFNVYIGNKGCVADDIWFGIKGSNGSYVRQPIQTPPLVCGQLLSFNSFSEKPTLSY